jgi:hypothetical protein
MKAQPESANVPAATVRDDNCKNSPRLRTIHNPWIHRALAVHAAGTR